MGPEDSRIYRFGAFLVEPGARSLTLNEQPVPLTPKAFDLLVYMARNPGRLLTKEELLAAVWPDSVVEEGNLSQNVFLLRKALAETGKENRYILTIPGRGYQFAASAETAPQLVIHAAHTQTTAIVEEEYFDSLPERLPDRLLATGKRSRLIWVGCAALALTAAGGVIAFRVAQPPIQAGHQEIIVADFINHGKDPAFDLTLRRALEIELGQSPYVSVLPQSKAAETLRMMGRPADEILSEPVAREICARNGGQAVIAGEIVSIGSHYLVTLDALACATGSAIWRAKAEATSKEDVLSSMDRVAEQVRRRLGESSRSIRQFDVPIYQATTKSFDALVAYSKGHAMLALSNAAGAIPLFDRAIELDSKFALAYEGRGSALYNLQEHKRASDDYAKAYALRDGATEREKLAIAARYYNSVDEDLERTADTYKLWTKLYPSDNAPWENLASTYILMGRYRESVAAAREALKLDAQAVQAYVTLARAQKKANLFEDARATCREAFAHGLDSWHLHSILFQIAYFQKDQAGMARESQWDRGKATENATLDNEAFAAATGGRIRFAHEMFRAAIAASRRERLDDFPASVLTDEAQVDLLAGFLPEARSEAEKVPADQETEVSTQAGITAALSGGSTYAADTIARLRSDPRRSVLRDQVDIPLLRAAVAIYRKRAREAVVLLETTQVYELRDYAIPFLRGRAYLDAKNPEAAVNEYRMIAGNPGIDPISPMYPLAYLGLARAYGLEGKRGQSRAAYEHFLALWKDADANVPVLQEARREYDNLPSN
ncbi:MAG TPA: winged helix-turn-helix domain-containing protein [Bryobacteraceae bacterium]|nr:winged helix-turn-helix domain-containing protein [Bryobacteraceae bacterium]